MKRKYRFLTVYDGWSKPIEAESVYQALMELSFMDRVYKHTQDNKEIYLVKTGEHVWEWTK